MSDTTDATNLYGYTPTKSVTIILLLLFATSSGLHAFQSIRYRVWFVWPTAILCGVAEVAGWYARFKSSTDPTAKNYYIIQSTATVLAPTPLLAVCFIILGRIIMRLGDRYSRLRARWYTKIFLACDIIAIFIQGGGGGIASGATTESKSKLGSDIMLVGIIFQSVAIVIYSILGIEFVTRYLKDRPFPGREDSGSYVVVPLTKRLKMQLWGLVIMTMFLFIRAIYRIIELADGWGGPVMKTEWLFNFFDAAMIVCAIFTLNFFHPGMLLAPHPEDDDVYSQVQQPFKMKRFESDV